MAPHMSQILCSGLFLLSFFHTQTDAILPQFPKKSELFLEFYQTEAQVTNLDQEVTALATEYYDNSVPRGKVDVLVAGNRQSIAFNNETNQIFEMNSTTCVVKDLDTSDYDYTPLFYGWLNRFPLVIGPAAPLFYAQDNRDKMMYKGNDFSIRDIKAEAWTLPIVTKTDNVELTYYFAVNTWTTPYGMAGYRVPVRIEARGNSTAQTRPGDPAQPINQITDFAYFRPTIDDWRAMQPTEGLGCEGRISTRTMPKVPKVFKYSAEVYDLKAADNKAETEIAYRRVWYDYDRQIARMDKYTKLVSTSELYDFNTGVTYSITDRRTCRIQPLRGSWFETYFTHAVVGHFKTPEEVLNLDGDFYYMGDKLIRSIWCEVYESVDFDVIYGKTLLHKLVVTAYFSQDNYKAAVDGEEETRIPVFIQIRGYSSVNEVSINLQYNIFGFDDVIWPEMYESFQLDRCFPSMNDKAYFVLMMNVDTKLATIMEGQDPAVIELLRNSIERQTGVSDMRIPILHADYKTSGVYFTGLMLDRPPALKQFWMEFEGEEITRDDHLKPVIDADTQEKCALACVQEQAITCFGFIWCGQACYLKSKDIMEPTSENERQWELGVCQTWMRAEKNSLGLQPYLPEALQSLEDAVLQKRVNITLPLDAKNEVIIPVSEIVIGDGPYTGNDNQDASYSQVISFAKLKSADLTTQSADYASTLNDCYRACKDSESLDCASFSYCEGASNKQCRLSSRLVVDRKTNPDDTEEDPNCYVYSLKYMDFFTAYPGRSLLISGEESSTVKTVEECARNCRTHPESKFPCRGFEYCRSAKSCVLHSKHVLDLTHGQMSKEDKKSTCTHYAARFEADYDDKGYTLVLDESNVRGELSLEECARVCSEEMKDKCRSFNYCPASSQYATDSSCALSEKTLRDDIKSGTKDKCHHFEKKAVVDDWAKVKVLGKVDSSGYTSKGFTGLVIGMLALGLVLGAIGFVVYSYYKSKSHGEGMTVRFMKSDI